MFAEDETNGIVDLISADALQVNNSNTILGYDDPEAIVAVPAVDENNVTDEEKGARSRWSYNNMVETLVKACKNATGLTIDGTNVISIRSVGNANVKYTSTGITGTDNPGTYTYDWQTLNAESDWYTTKGYYNYNMKDEDYNYESDYSTMTRLGIRQADNEQYYWLASRKKREGATSVRFDGRFIYPDGNNGGYGIWNASLSPDAWEQSYCVRPIVTLNYSLISSQLD